MKESHVDRGVLDGIVSKITSPNSFDSFLYLPPTVIRFLNDFFSSDERLLFIEFWWK